MDLAKSCLAPEAEDRIRNAHEIATRLSDHFDSVQERLRLAEVAGVKERARRRLTVVVAASLIMILLTTGLGLSYWVQQRQESEARVAMAIKETTLLRDRALAKPDEPQLWVAAQDSLDRARSNMDNLDSRSEHQLSQLANQIESGLFNSKRDAVLIENLIDIRTATAADKTRLMADNEYMQVFRQADIDFETLGVAEAANKISQRPESVRRGIIAALDHWMVLRKKLQPSQGMAWSKLVAIARKADSDSDRNIMRSAILQDDKSIILRQMKVIAESANLNTWEPASLVLLANTMANAGDVEAGVQVLASAAGTHPMNVWVHYNRGNLLLNTRPIRLEEAIEAYSAARALQPETGHQLAHLLERVGRDEEAEAMFLDLIQRRDSIAKHKNCYAHYLKKRNRQQDAESQIAQAILNSRDKLVKDPDSINVLNALAISLASIGKVDEALKATTRIIELDPNDAVSHYNHGIVLHKDPKRVNEAIASFRKAIELNPKYGEAYVNLGNALSDQGNMEEAIANCKKAIELDPNILEAHKNLGIYYSRHSKWNLAIQCLRNAIELEPGDDELYYSLANSLHQSGSFEDAIPYYRKSIDINPANSRALVNLGAIFSNKIKEFDTAMELFDKALKIAPDNSLLHTNRGITQNRLGDVSSAIASLTKAIELDPEDGLAIRSLASIYGNKGDNDESIRLFRMAIKLDPDDARLHNSLGLELGRRGLLDQALESFKTSVELAPEYLEANKNLGFAYVNQRKAQLAIPQLQKSVKLGADDYQIHYLLGAMLSRVGQFDKAIVSLRRAVELDPRKLTAPIEMARALAQLGEFSEMISILEQTAKRAPKNDKVIALLASAHAANGDHEAAVEIFKKSIELAPENPQALCNLGQSLAHLGRHIESLDAFRRGHAIGSKMLGWPYPSQQWVKDAEKKAALEKRLLLILDGKAEPDDDPERIRFAELCYARKRYRESARFYQDALLSSPDLAEDRQSHRRYNAACVATLASFGKSKDAQKLGVAERSKLRQQAIDWLQEDLNAWKAFVETDTPMNRTLAIRMMRHWQNDLELNGLRDKLELERLPVEQAKKCEQLWDDVNALLKSLEEPDRDNQKDEKISILSR